MNTIEQQLWDYIDGNLDSIQAKAIEERIASETAIKTLYESLLQVNTRFNQMDFDEPSMSFTRNVMERIESVPAPVVLKTKVDQRIIRSLAAFFILAVAVPLAYAISQSELHMPAINFDFNFQKYVSPLALNIFLGFDLILALILVDFFMRKKLRQQNTQA